MKYLSPEIEAMSKKFEKTTSLIRTNISCGIFQNLDYTKKGPKLPLHKKP